MKKRIIGMVTILLLILSLLPVMTTDVSAKESAKRILVVSAKTSGDKTVKLSWTKVSGADKYVVYGARYGKKNVKIKTVKKNTSYTVKKISGKKLAAHKDYNFYVVAYKGKKKLVKSDMIRFITAGTQGKYANVKKVTATKKSVSLAPGKSAKLSYKAVLPKGKKHVKVTKAYKAKTRFYSDNTKVATVTSKGKVKAVAAGKANIYIQDMNGKYCKVKVTVEGSKEPTPAPTGKPTATPVPSGEPTAVPTPTGAPTGIPTADPTPVPTYTVTFDVQGFGTAPAPVTGVKSGTTIAEPTPPTTDGYIFGGWYTEAACENVWDFSKDVVSGNRILYAKWIYAGPLCFTAETANSTVCLIMKADISAISMQYSTDGEVWNVYTIGSGISLADVGDKVYFKANTLNHTFSSKDNGWYQFVMTGKIAASGNIMSLLDATGNSVEIPCEGCFRYLFTGCESLTSAPLLPVTSLTKNCYMCMFQNCTNLTSAPALPAMTMTENCYENMFQKCTNLTSAPTLPATVLAGNCYSAMFEECTGLTSAPALPATNLAPVCYCRMFMGCTNLTGAPVLPAEDLKTDCYELMFSGCKKLNKITLLAKGNFKVAEVDNPLYAWLAGRDGAVAGTIITDNPRENFWVDDSSGIPVGWNIQPYTTAP